MGLPMTPIIFCLHVPHRGAVVFIAYDCHLCVGLSWYVAYETNLLTKNQGHRVICDGLDGSILALVKANAVRHILRGSSSLGSTTSEMLKSLMDVPSGSSISRYRSVLQ